MSNMLFKKILVIDDDVDCIKPLCKFLTLNKLQVNVANNGFNGLELQSSLKFDAIITDLRMDGMSGVEVIDAVHKTFPDTPIIVISGFINDQQFKDISENKNICAVFQKPLDFDGIISKIKEIVQ